MREAMANAVVGDDVYGDDPTVNRLQEMAAARVGMEAALFVTSGTQGNLVAAMSHCTRGDEAIIGAHNHMCLYEAGGISVLGGIHSRQVPVQPDGTLALDDVRAAIRPDNVHFPVSRLVCIENTHGVRGGVPVTPEYTRAVADLAHENGLKLHIDGARIFNAATALGCDVSELTSPADSVQFCLSKGLCAPVGSLVCGSADFIERALRVRKILGGGMRQVGVLAAAGIIALEEMTQRLAEDHATAKQFAEGLAAMPSVRVDTERVKTNMIFFDIDPDWRVDAYEIAERAKAEKILLRPKDSHGFRIVTHYWVKPADVEKVLGFLRGMLV